MMRTLLYLLVLVSNFVIGFLAIRFIAVPMIWANTPLTNGPSDMAWIIWPAMALYIAVGFAIAIFIFQVSSISSWKEGSPLKVFLSSPLLLSTHLLYFMTYGLNNRYYPIVMSLVFLLWSLLIIWLGVYLEGREKLKRKTVPNYFS